MRAVLYSEAWENIIEADPEVLYIQIEQIDPSKVRDLISMLRDEDVDELFILDECEVFDPTVTVEAFIITDHVNATGDNPLIGPNDDTIGVRFPDMTFPYSEELNSAIKMMLERKNISYAESVLYGSEGPPEDKAELARLGKLGCRVSNYEIMWIDIAARHAGINVGAAVMRK